MNPPSASFSVTLRIVLSDARQIGAVTTLIAADGASIVALDVVEAHADPADEIVFDVTCNAVDEDHADRLRQAIEALGGARVRAVSDRTMLVHLGGLITVVPKVPLKTRDDLSMAYTPGVARVCQAIAADPATARNLTIKRNTVAVVTDGSAVLGLGDLGPAAALPVMEGKAALFQRFGGVDAWPVCIDSHDVDEIVRTVELIAPSYGGINLEDIAAPRCFVIERRLRAALDIPVFHDDQHGTAIVVLAGLLNALRVVGKELGDVRAVVLGIGAAGTAITRLLLAAGIGDVTAVDRQGILTGTTSGLDEDRAWVAAHTNLADRTGALGDAIAGADVLVGVSGPGLVSAEHLSSMSEGAVVFALANPDPEVQPAIARRFAAVVATGRSDQPNQINNVLVFPGFFRGLLRSGARTITEEMELAAARALAGVVGDNERSATYIVPSVFNPAVVPAVSDAVEAAARRSTGATAP